jgi:DNA-binding CsgD family transcriptional regulator
MLHAKESSGEMEFGKTLWSSSAIQWRQIEEDSVPSLSQWLWRRLAEGQARALAWVTEEDAVMAIVSASSGSPLTELEQTVLHRMVAGTAYKVIAAQMGLSTWRARVAGVGALERLGIPSRCQAVWLGTALLGETSVPVQILNEDGRVIFDIDAEKPMIVHLTVPRWPALSEAEHRVGLALMSGATDPEIALRRGTSVRTVANQIQGIGRKLGASGRLEIVKALVQGQGDPLRRSGMHRIGFNK